MDHSELTIKLRQAAKGAEFMSQKQVLDCMGWKSHKTANKYLAGMDVYKFGRLKLYAVTDLSKQLSRVKNAF
jgi:hypothetical protein